ncbi:LysR family transcriptional regulator [Streptomyces sp. NPDC050610]|uniref:LysR family transcriptional regulator n=1 Tax=Streptomyces sp. NPDC050610 TaxID=3157097 RepID=UPI003447DCB3
MTIELRHLRCFLAIAEAGSVTRAAAGLHLTQPAVSRTLRRLETELGTRLVDRSTHHLELTEAGHAFRAKAAAAVAAFDDAVDVGRLHPWPLRLGHAWSAFGAYTTPLLLAWGRAHPETPLEFLRIDDRTAGLARGAVDVALLRGEVRAPGLVTEVILTEPRLAAVPTADPLATRPELTLADLADHPVALNTVAGSTTLDLWPPARRPTATVTVANNDDWLAAISARRAVGVTTSATAVMHQHPDVAYIPLVDAPELPLSLAWHSGPGHPAIPELVALARQVSLRAT